MAEWSDEASEYLEEYLKQVAVLARRVGEEPEDVISGLRDHIANDLATGGSDRVTLERLVRVLRNLGTPEQVVSVDVRSVGTSSPDRPHRQRSSRGNRTWACCLVAFVGSILTVFVLMFVVYFLTFDPGLGDPPGAPEGERSVQ